MSSKANKHRTTPDPTTITRIKGYPDKLIIYLCEASTFWQIRYFAGKTYHKKSSRTYVKQEAIEAAKKFYDDINFKQRVGPNNKHELFENQAIQWLNVDQARKLRGQITPDFSIRSSNASTNPSAHTSRAGWLVKSKQRTWNKFCAC